MFKFFDSKIGGIVLVIAFTLQTLFFYWCIIEKLFS